MGSESAARLVTNLSMRKAVDRRVTRATTMAMIAKSGNAVLLRGSPFLMV